VTPLVFLVDCRDSFTANLAHALAREGARVDVKRGRDALDAVDRAERDATHVVLSPGPGSPEAATEADAILRRFERTKPILGVCLGHQVIARRFGAVVRRAERPVHGATGAAVHDGRDLFEGAPRPMIVARYHSLVVEASTVAAPLAVVATDEGTGAAMALRHRDLPIFGVQFHPESFLTVGGDVLLRNFLRHGPTS
jgi:anthranilate synthase/aminodeoxychorismate synthase-like glutamine amidotransferase